MTTDRICAAVLAAGLSSRMGNFKPLLKLGDRPLLQHVLDTARAARISDIVLVLGYRASEVRARMDLSGISVVENADFTQGMSTSLRAGIAALPRNTSAAFIMLADMPLISPGTLTNMMEHLLRTRANAVVPVHDGKRGNPVLLDASALAGADSLGGDEGFRRILTSLPRVEVLDVQDPGILLDCDSAEALQQCRTIYQQRLERSLD